MAPRRRRGATDSIPTGRNRSSSSCTSSATTGDRLRRGPRSSTARSGDRALVVVRSASTPLTRCSSSPTARPGWRRLQASSTQVLGRFYHAARTRSLRRWTAQRPAGSTARGGSQASTGGRGDPALRDPRAHGRQDPLLPKNRHRFAYTTMVGLGLPRGSGAVESAIRRVINLRIKGASIYWLPESVDAILLLRSFYKSGRWNCSGWPAVGVSA